MDITHVHYIHICGRQIVVLTRGVSNTRTRGVPSVCARRFPYTCTYRSHAWICVCVCGYSLRKSLGRLPSDSLETPIDFLESP